jgi:restriction system protein
MGAIIFSIREYFDAITETVAIKSGLLLTNAETTKILKQEFNGEFLDADDLDTIIRVRADEIEYHIQWVRISIGNLPETSMGPMLASPILMPWIKKGYDALKTMDIFVDVYKKSGGITSDAKTVIRNVQEQIDVPEKLIIDIALLLAEQQFRSSYIAPKKVTLDGATPLAKLFSCELHGKEGFMDQAFLDYLAVNSENLEYIHWRNFEKLCAEYFSRQGFKIILGPGSNDGGVDIRAFSEKDPNQPLLLIQCKRHHKKNIVDIPTVKAFYSDVAYEKAKHGIIATTAYIAPGGKKVTDARNYPLSFAESEVVKQWAKSMWRYGNS